MSTVEHPLKGTFDTAAASWEIFNDADGHPGLEVGFAENGMVALRKPDGPTLIYTRSEWEAFSEGVKDGEFDLERF